MAAQQLKVFVSHSAQDKLFCDALVAALRAAGADVWYDEHSLGAGVLRGEMMRELAKRPIFLVVLSPAAFASGWVRDACEWAYNLSKRESHRLLLPVVAAAYTPRDFNAVLFLESLRRVEAPDHQPYPQAEAIARTLHLLTLTPAGEAPTPLAPQPGESAEDLLTRGEALHAQDKPVEALALFERAIQLAPNSFEG